MGYPVKRLVPAGHSHGPMPPASWRKAGSNLFVRCPSCAHVAEIGASHVVACDGQGVGTVTPVWDCPACGSLSLRLLGVLPPVGGGRDA